MNSELIFPTLGLFCFALNFIVWRAFDANRSLHAKTGEWLMALQWFLAVATIFANILILMEQLPSFWLSIFVGILLTVQYGASAWLHFARRPRHERGISTNA